MAVLVETHKDCDNCERKDQACVAFASASYDLIHVCVYCLTDAQTAICGAVALEFRNPHFKPARTTGPNCCKHCGRACVNESCDDCARREYRP